MDIKIKPTNLNGSINAISSKSDAHRALLCSFLSGDRSMIGVNIMSEDIYATISCLKDAGHTVSYDKHSITMQPNRLDLDKDYTFYPNESGSTLRFLIPVVAALGLRATFIGSGRLPYRPLSPLLEQLQEHHITFTKPKDRSLPLTLAGKLTSGEFTISGDISSQFVTGLLLALPICDGDSKLVITPPVESRPYIDMTLNTLKQFGINILETKEGLNTCFNIKGNQSYKSPGDINIEGDWSNTAFWIAAGALSDTGLTVHGLREDSLQGDKYILNHIKDIGATSTKENNSYLIKKDSLIARDLDASAIPDLVPVIASIASVSKGTTRIYNAGRLRIKESDRLQAISQNLINLGADVTELEDGLIITGKEKLYGGTTDSYNDHRIAMSMAVISSYCSNPVIIKNANAVNKSYPTFFEDFKKLGGVFDVIDIW